MIYLDNAATSGKKPAVVIGAINYALNMLCANPGRSGHTRSAIVAEEVYKARKKISDFFQADGPENIVFTANCTMAINMVLKGVISKGDHIVISDLEHNAVMRPLENMGIDYTAAEVSLESDENTIKNFEKAIKKETKMIFCTGASNVLGNILPIEKIGMLCKERGLLFGVDAAQTAGIIPINMTKSNIDYLCIAPHKCLYSPMGLGVLIARKPIERTIIQGGTGSNSRELIQGNNLPEDFESGTINVPAIFALNRAIGFVENNYFNFYEREMKMLQFFYDEIAKNENIVLYTKRPYKFAFAPLMSLNLYGKNSEETAAYLNRNGLCVRAGLHCAPTAHKKIGTTDIGTVRVSTGYFNNITEIKKLIYLLKKY